MLPWEHASLIKPLILNRYALDCTINDIEFMEIFK